MIIVLCLKGHDELYFQKIVIVGTKLSIIGKKSIVIFLFLKITTLKLSSLGVYTATLKNTYVLYNLEDNLTLIIWSGKKFCSWIIHSGKKYII